MPKKNHPAKPQPVVAVAPESFATPVISGAVAARESVFQRRVLLTVTTALAAILLAVLIIYTAEVLTLLFASVLLAVFLSAPADLLARFVRVPRGAALAFVLLVLLTFFSLFGFSLSRTVYLQVHEFQRAVPVAIQALQQDIKHAAWLKRFTAKPNAETAPATTTSEPRTASAPATTSAPATEPAEENPGDALAGVIERGRELAGDLLKSERFYKSGLGALSATAGVLSTCLLIFAIGLFLAISPGMYINGLVTLFPIARRPRTRQIISAVGGSLQWWFIGQLCSMFAVFILTYIGLFFLGVPAALTLAILAGLMTFIPNFGPIIAALPALLLAIAPHADQTQINWQSAVFVIVLYFGVQFAEGWLITPMIQKRAVHLPPALIMLSQVTLLLLLGGLGLLLATPILASVMVIVRMTYVEDVLGDHSMKIKAGPLAAAGK